jgi:uncharacterized protein
MKLTRVERWILSNQLRILGKLFPNAAERWNEAQEVLESGYEPHYDILAQNVSEATMSEEDCRDVTDILDMFSMLNRAIEGITERSGIYQHGLKFHGFSSNQERRALAYAEFLCRHDGGRFKDLHIREFDSHSPMMDTYRLMLREWKSSENQQKLTKDDIVRITNAARD